MTVETVARHLKRRDGVTVAAVAEATAAGEDFDRGAKRFRVSDRLSRRSVRFRLLRLVAALEEDEALDDLAASAALSSAEARARLKRALASYFAGAVTMPYAAFRAGADDARHDMLRLGARFDASFEQVAHRLATLRRPGAEGVPIHFVRTDIAGNISKRFSASGLRLPRYGGACPRWVLHHAFATPGRVVRQVARLPDGEAYLFLAHADVAAPGTGPSHAVMIGAAIAHAERFACADGLDLEAPGLAVPVGITCRQCPRDDCSERAFERIALPGETAGAPADDRPRSGL